MKILRTDKEQRLVRMIDSGDASAMDELYACFADYLAGVCFRYTGNDDDTKDVLQEAFIKVFTQIGTFEYRGRGSLKAWLTRIVVNESLMFLRNNSRLAVTDTAADVPDAPDEPPNTDGIDITVLMEMVARLPVGYRTVFNLYAIDGLSHKQIAERLGIAPGTSATQYLKARNMLARMITEYRKRNE